jgi:hypothetical protein
MRGRKKPRFSPNLHVSKTIPSEGQINQLPNAIIKAIKESQQPNEE